MPIFTTTTIRTKNTTVGSLLRNTRHKYKLKLFHIEEFTKIRRSYITAIENNQWDKLPSISHARNFVIDYAKFLELDHYKIANRFDIETKDITTTQAPDPIQNIIKPKYIITPKLVIISIFLLALFGIFGFTYIQINRFIETPKLLVNKPSDYEKLSSQTVEISGQTDPENIVYINNQPLTTDKNGNFNIPVELKDGYNLIQITAKNRLGKTASTTKIVYSENKESTTSNSMKLNILAKDSDIWLRLKNDNQEIIFEGNIPANTTQDFSTDQLIFLTTTNAGNTYVTINDHNLGPVGKPGEVITDMKISQQPKSQSI